MVDFSGNYAMIVIDNWVFFCVFNAFLSQDNS